MINLIEQLPLDTWINAANHKPQLQQDVLARFADGHKAPARWNGYYWVGQHNMRFSCGDNITHFLIYSPFSQDDIYD